MKKLTLTTCGMLAGAAVWLTVGIYPAISDEGATETPAEATQAVGVEKPQTMSELPTFGDWRDLADPGDRWLFWMLEQPVPTIEVSADTPLSQVLARFAVHFTETHGRVGDQSFAMTFWSDDATLELENIDGLDDVKIVSQDSTIPPVKLRTALSLVLGRTVDPPLSYVIRNGVIEVTTVDEANSENSMMTRLYPVADLIDGVDSSGANGNGGGFIGAVTPVISASSQFRLLVQKLTGPGTEWQDINGQGGVIAVFRGHLIILQTESGHAAVARLLKLLRRTETADRP